MFDRRLRPNPRRHSKSNWFTTAAVILAATSAQRAMAVTNYYWDLNGATAGSGGPTPSGVWDNSTANWDNSSAGTGTPVTFSNNTTNGYAFFSAGTDATGSYTVTVASTGVAVTGVTVKDGTLTIAGQPGSSLTLAASFTASSSAGPVTFDSSLGNIYIYHSTAFTGSNQDMTFNVPIVLRPHYSITAAANGSGNLVFNGVISAGGPGDTYPIYVSSTGSGQVIFNNTNTYTGTTHITSGTLLANATSATSSTTVFVNGGTLGGHGSIAGAVSVAGGATVLAGDGSTGSTLTLGSDLTLNTGSTIALALDGSGAHSVLARSGSGTWTFDPNQAFSAVGGDGVYVGEVFTGVITGLGSDPGTGSWVFASGPMQGTFAYDSGAIDLTMTAVPEPTAGLFLCGGLLILRPRRRTRPGRR